MGYAELELEFIEKLFNNNAKLSAYYRKLGEVGLDTETKLASVDNLRYAFFRMKNDKMKKALAEFNALFPKIQKQAILYNHCYSILLNQMPVLERAFRNAGGNTGARDYIALHEFRKQIWDMPIFRFSQMQGNADHHDICSDSRIASEIERRFNDKKLAQTIKTERTGTGEKGRSNVVHLIDKRLDEMKTDHRAAHEYYKDGIRNLKELRGSLERFEKLRGYVKQELEIYGGLTKDNYLYGIERLFVLFGEEARVENQNYEILKKKSRHIKKKLAKAKTLDRSLSKESWYNSRLWWEKHDETIYLMLDFIALAAAFSSPPFSTAVFGGAAALRRAGLFGRIAGFFRQNRIFKIAGKTIKGIVVGTEDANLIRDCWDVGNGLMDKAKKLMYRHDLHGKLDRARYSLGLG